MSLGCPGQSLPKEGELLASPHRSALTVLPFAAGLAAFLESFLVARGGFCRGHAGSRPIRFPKIAASALCRSGGADSPLPSAMLGGEQGVCACREQAEVEVQDPKARAKANWLRAFNKVCMQLQEVSNSAAARRQVPAPAACWAGGIAPSHALGIFRSPIPWTSHTLRAVGTWGPPRVVALQPHSCQVGPPRGAGSAEDLPLVCAACGVLVRAPPLSPLY